MTPRLIPRMAEILFFLKASLRLARFDATAAETFPNSLPMVWRSFFVAVLVLPIFAFDVFSKADTELAHVPGLRLFVIALTSHVISWVAFPLAMITMVKVLQREPFFNRYIIAYNWSMLVQTLIIVPFLFMGTQAIVESALQPFITMIFLYLAVYTWFVAKAVLNISGFAAFAVLALDMIVELMVLTAAGGLYGAPPSSI